MSQEKWVLRVLQVQRENLVKQALWVPEDLLDLMEFLEWRVQQVQRESQVLKDLKE